MIKSDIFLTATGMAAVAIGVLRGNELMIATGIVIIAVDCGAKKVVSAIKDNKKGGAE